MDIYHHLPHATARRFESGTPNSCGLFAAEAGLELLLETGLEQVGALISRTTNRIKAAIDDNGWDLVTPRQHHGAMLAIRALDAPAMVARLTARDIILTERDGNIRVASHYFNDAHDVQRLVTALQEESTLLA
jgi:selenocysteine lyase/cysteine desulfurase